MKILEYLPNFLQPASSPSIEEIIEQLDTLDILLLNGQGFWFSYLIEWSTWNNFSHIGIVLKSPTWLDPSLTDIYFLESGMESRPDALDHQIKFGVQITPLRPLLKEYDGHIYYRKLNSLAFRDHPEYYYQKMIQIHAIIHDKPYDDNLFDLLKAELRLRLGNCRKTSEFFCSALVGFIYTQLGFLPADTNWDLLQPKDFDVKYKVQSEMDRQHLGTLGPLIKIK